MTDSESEILIARANELLASARHQRHACGTFDNHAQSYDHIKVVPLSAAMGAEICGIDCRDVSDAALDEIRHALFRHKMIYFRDQAGFDHAAHWEFSRRLGAFAEDAYTDGISGFREVQPLIKEAEERTGWLFGSGWHTDSPFLEKPPAISTLRAVDVPPYGGDTLWANGALAYASLGPDMQERISGLRVHMSMRDVLVGARAYAAASDSPVGRLARNKDIPMDAATAVKVVGQFHPLVRTHPVTGEKSLYCDPSYAIGVEGMARNEAEDLLQFLCEHITQPAFTCRLRWQTGTFALWDNRLCLHQAFNDYDGFRREMYRTTIAGEIPV